MLDYQKRVVDEKNQLDEKLAKLTEFMHGDIYAKMPPTDQGLLMVQLVAMENYSSALKRRIERF